MATVSELGRAAQRSQKSELLGTTGLYLCTRQLGTIYEYDWSRLIVQRTNQKPQGSSNTALRRDFGFSRPGSIQESTKTTGGLWSVGGCLLVADKDRLGPSVVLRSCSCSCVKPE